MKEYDWGTDLIGTDFVVNEISPERQAEARTKRAEMLEQLSDADEHIMEHYLEGTGTSARGASSGAIRKATIAGQDRARALWRFVPE